MPNTYTGEHGGYRMKWTARRSTFDCDVYTGSGPWKLLHELEYPKVFRTAEQMHEAFKAEAALIVDGKADKSGGGE